jgi:hypothetical protein
VVVALPGVQLLDVSGPLDVFAQVNVRAGYPACHWGDARGDCPDHLGYIEDAVMDGSRGFHFRSRQ